MCQRCRIPSPLKDLGWQTILQETRATPLVFDDCVPCQKKRRMMLSIWRCTPFGIRKMALKYMGMATKTDCNITIRPPRERSRACHPPRRASIFTITGCQSQARSLPFARGSPRYRRGNKATGVASTADTRSNSSKDNPIPTTEDFHLFSCSPENMSSMVDTWCAVTVDPHKKNMVSFAYCSNGMPPGRPVVWNPARYPRLHSCSVQMAKVSAANMNKRGARGHPCLMPCCG